MDTDLQIQDFKIPQLPKSFDKGLDALQNFGKSTFDKTKELTGSVSETLKSKLSLGSGSSNNLGVLKENGEERNIPVDFNSIARIEHDPLVFGGLMALPGSYTMDFKTSCEDGQYNKEVNESLQDIIDSQLAMNKLFSQTGFFLNVDNNQNGIFIRRNVPVSCYPKLEKYKPKTQKIGERCVHDSQCIPNSTEHRPKCKKAVRDKYLSGICSEIIRGEGKKCKEVKDCGSQYLDCVNKRCTKKGSRVPGSSSSYKSKKVNTNIPLENFKGLGLKPKYGSRYNSGYGSSYGSRYNSGYGSSYGSRY